MIIPIKHILHVELHSDFSILINVAQKYLFLITITFLGNIKKNNKVDFKLVGNQKCWKITKASPGGSYDCVLF